MSTKCVMLLMCHFKISAMKNIIITIQMTIHFNELLIAMIYLKDTCKITVKKLVIIIAILESHGACMILNRVSEARLRLF